MKIFTLLILLLLLPVSAWAADGIELYVGGQRITESGCYANQNGTWTKVEGTGPSHGQFYYDAATFTLTLNEAKITHDQTVNVAEGYTYYGSVIAFSQSADVSLKIVVSQGTSTITGNGGIRVVSEAGDASLSISGPGSLEVNVDKNDSGISLIGSKNVNLNIDGADVKTLAATYYGVDLHAGDGFKAAAVVNNGKLTAGGSGGIGIYYRWNSPSDSGTSSLTVSGNAVVDTRDSKILIASQASEVQVSAGSDGNGGIVFDGKSGTVYGKVELQEDLEIGTDESLTIPEDASLTVPEGTTLTNNGTLTSHGTVINQGTLDSSNGMIDCQHHSGGTATCTEKAKCSLCGTEYGNLAPHTLTKKEAQAPTCTEPGNIAYWICSVCNKLFRDEAGTQVITEEDTKRPALGHDWGKPVYTWSDDNTACTAKRVCQHDASHTETATATVTSEPTKAPTCTEMGETTYTATFSETWAETQITTKDIPATGHHYLNGTCTECGQRDPDYRPDPDPISYYNIYVEDVCEGVEVTTSKNVVREGNSISVYVEKDTANYTFDNFQVYYKRSYYGVWEVLEEGVQPGEYPINNIWTHIYIKAEGAEEKEDDPTGMEQVEGVKVYTKDGSFYVQTPQREQVIIVSMSGAVVKSEEQIGLKQYHGLQPGIYIVRVGDRAYKLRLASELTIDN